MKEKNNANYIFWMLQYVFLANVEVDLRWFGVVAWVYGR